MKCEIIRDLLPLYIEELCSEESKKEIEQHLEYCPDCRRDCGQMRQDFSSKTDTRQTESFLKEKDLLQKSKEEIKHDYANHMINRLFTVIFPLSLLFNVIMIAVTFLIYQYRYPWFYFKELGTAQVLILLLPFLPTSLALGGKILLAKHKKAKVCSMIIVIGMLPAILLGSVCTLAFIAIPPVASITTSPSNYLKLDGDLKSFEHVVTSFYPARIPEHATQIDYRYERYTTIFSDRGSLEASWTLQPDDYEAAKNQVLNSRQFKNSSRSEMQGAGSVVSVIEPGQVTISFEYNDQNHQVSYRASIAKNY